MKFEESKYFKTLIYSKIEKPFGIFYFFETFVISEIHEGIHFDLEMIDIISQDILKFYDNTGLNNPRKLVYITNKVNSYSINPNFWLQMEDKYGFSHIRIIVFYTNWAYTNIAIERMFSKAKIKCYHSLDEAIKWTLSLNMPPKT
ncbi:hypothetical protein ACFFU9_07405 [Mariniflexile ostreae]|uniref:SpoIIAA-like protein n=1 Tax=Mariniflexile ostreae TaxID=1520892 RepID=A0ABV5FAW4_9FLAO